MTGGANNTLHVTTGAAIYRSNFHTSLPHLFIRHAVSANHTDMLELGYKVTQFEHFSQVEIDNDNICEIALDVVANLVQVAGHDDILEMRVQVCGKTFGNDAI